MAGAGYKVFASGDVLSASDVNTYFMQQTVMVFANASARTTALSTVLAEGMVSYLQDTNSLEVYDGSAWVGATGDITGLTAGTGVSITSATGPVPTVAIDTAVVPRLGVANTFTVGPQTLNTGAAGSIGLIVKGASGQSAKIQEWQNNSGTTLNAIGTNGEMQGQYFGALAGGKAFIQTNFDTNGLAVLTGAAANKGLIVRGAASQTANLQEWQNSAGTNLATVRYDGVINAPEIRTSSNNIMLREENSGGFVNFIRETAAGANPGANQAKLYFRDGTNAGTLKLVVRAGAAGAETTILDNIPQ